MHGRLNSAAVSRRFAHVGFGEGTFELPAIARLARRKSPNRRCNRRSFGATSSPLRPVILSAEAAKPAGTAAGIHRVVAGIVEHGVRKLGVEFTSIPCG